jgi:hypothetical protein
MAIVGFISSLWNRLAYKYSLELGKELNLLVSTPIKPDNRLTILKLSDPQ